MDLSIDINGNKLRNPVMPASGPLTANPAACERIAAQGVGAIVTKTISTTEAVVAKPAIAKVTCGMLNCELWSEKEPQVWFSEYLPAIAAFGVPVIVSAGYQPEDLERLIPSADRFAAAFELSSHYLGTDPQPIYQIARTAKSLTDKPVFIKLSPHVPDLAQFARAAVSGGADGIVAINSLGPALRIDIRKRSSPLGSKDGCGWLSGPAIKPIALRAVHTIAQAVDVPVIGVGGIASAEDMIEFMMAGASAVQLLTSAMISGIDLFARIIADLSPLLEELGIERITDLIGLWKAR